MDVLCYKHVVHIDHGYQVDCLRKQGRKHEPESQYIYIASKKQIKKAAVN